MNLSTLHPNYAKKTDVFLIHIQRTQNKIVLLIKNSYFTKNAQIQYICFAVCTQYTTHSPDCWQP